MAVAHDSVSESHTGASGSTSGLSFEWYHVPVDKRPRGLLVFTFVNANADDAVGVQVCGVALTAVTGGRAVDTAGEPGDCKAWLLGENVPEANDPGFGANAVFGIKYVGGYWLAGGAGSQIRYTTSLRDTWAASSSGGFNAYDFGYSGTHWVAVGLSGTLKYTTDPTGTWTTHATHGFLAANTINAVHYANGYWVAVADGGELRYCAGQDPTGAWSAPSSLGFGTSSINDVYFDGTYWVAVGDSGSIRYTTDPTGTWSAASSPGFGTNNVETVFYGNGYWVAGGAAGNLRYAADPTGTWSAASSPGFGTNRINDIEYANGYWVGVGAGSSMRYTTDPTGTWSSGSFYYPATSGQVYAVNYGNGYWAACGDSGPVGEVKYTPLVPTGTWYGAAWTITVTRNETANAMYAVGVAVTAANNTYISGTPVLLQGDGTLAEQAVADDSNGINSLRYCGINSGLGAVPSVGANTTSLGTGATIDYGQRIAGVCRETTAGQGSRSVGWSSGTSDDRAAVHLAVSERLAKASPPLSGVRIRDPLRALGR